MHAGIVVTLLRALILLGLLLAFAWSLVSSISSDQALGGTSLTSTAGRDPGLRVLILDRREGDLAPLRNHEKLVVDILRPALLLAPDQPDNQLYQRKLEPGDQLTVQPDADGLLFFCPSEERWPVSRLRLQPISTTPIPGLSGSHTLSQVDPCRCEDISGEAVFAVGMRRYRGSLEMIYKGPKQALAINLLPIEAYVEGVIAVEMKPSYPLEALKAQAIASRSYAFATRTRERNGRAAWDLTDSLDDQEYRGTGFGTGIVATAVKETGGIILGTPRLRQAFVPLFCASSGGWCESVTALIANPNDITGHEQTATIMSSHGDPLCQPAASALGNLGSHWDNVVVLTPDAIEKRLREWLKAKGEDVTKKFYVTDLKVIEQDAKSGRVQRVQIGYTSLKTAEMSGHEFRMMIGANVVRSTLWLGKVERVQRAGSTIKDFKFTTRGYGHGVGMSQISAWAMAKEGHPAARILQFFYSGAELQPW